MTIHKKVPKLAIIDYGMGNLNSVVKAWKQVGAEPYLISEAQEANKADILVFPGQGAIIETMAMLKKTGLDELIRGWIASDRPFFGICLGLQALFDFSEEGNINGLGVFKGIVKKFPAAINECANLKVPHMGWNSISFDNDKAGSIVENIRNDMDQFYFVHSYYVDPFDEKLILFETDYGKRFCSGIRYGNCIAVQFHPEKSQVKGLQLYSNILKTFSY